MPQLFFKKPFQDAIRAGTKRTTLRRWARPMMHAGQRAYVLGLGWLAIEAVEAVELEALGDDDARADGFETVKAMRKVLFAIYPDHRRDGKRWFRVAFTPAELLERRSNATARNLRNQSPSSIKPVEGAKHRSSKIRNAEIRPGDRLASGQE